MTTSLPTLTDNAEIDSVLREISALRVQQQNIYDRIRYLIRTLPQGIDIRPTWGPCTRCSHVWHGMYVDRPPRACPQCGSTGWQIPPKTAKARRPEDPPNPRWGKNRRTGKPTDGTMRENYGLKLTKRPPSRMRGAELGEPTAPREVIEAMGTRLTPPPRLADVAPSLVASEGVRFNEGQHTDETSSGRSIPPQLPVSLSNDGNSEVRGARLRNDSAEPYDDKAGSLSQASGESEVSEVRAELVEAVEGDGSLQGDEE